MDSPLILMGIAGASLICIVVLWLRFFGGPSKSSHHHRELPRLPPF
jgi:hypothetical protein